MTTTIVFAETSDNYIRSQHDTNYNTAADGSNLTLGNVNGTTLTVGHAGDVGQVVSTYNSTWSASWYNYGKRSTTRAYQGDPLVDGVGPNYSKIGFNDSAIRSDLSGAVIDKVELRMSNEHSWFSSGLVGRFGTHNNASEPGGSSSTTGSFNRVQNDFNKGQTKWITVPNVFGNELRDNTTKGITTGRTNAGNRSDYGYWRGWNSGASTRPQLRITYTAPGAGGFEIWLSYLQFDYTADADSTPVSMYMRLDSAGVTGSGVGRDVTVQKDDWGTTLTTASWRTRSQLFLTENQNFVGFFFNAHTFGSQVCRTGIERREEIDSPGTQNRYLLNNSNHRNGNIPSESETNLFRSADTSGTAQDPALFIAQATKHRLDMTLGAQAQLSDGTHVILEQSANAPSSGNVVLRHHDGTGFTTIDTVSLGSTGRRGGQIHAICVDASDNIYLAVRSDNESTTSVGSSAHRTLNIRRYNKGSGYSWTVGAVRATTFSSYWGDLNNIAMTWNSQGPAGGVIVVAISHMAGRNINNIDQAYAIFDADGMDAGGSFTLASGDLTPNLLNHGHSDVPGQYNFGNETGSMLDICATGPGRGFIAGTGGNIVLGQSGQPQLGRYTLAGNGASVSNSSRRTDHANGLCTKDADAKLRVIPISDNTVVRVSADPRTGHGIVVRYLRNEGTSIDWTTLAHVQLDEEGIDSMPDASVLAISGAWDAAYSPIEHRVWIYYFDDADDQRLMRTHVDLNSGLAGGSEIEVADEVGAAGSTNHAIRLNRGHCHGLQRLISVANETSGGAHSMIYVVDNISIAPEQPSLHPKANFNADLDAVFSWTFNHANPAASQGAFELEIDNADTETQVYSTGKVSSSSNIHTLPAEEIDNGEDFRWRVRTWDEGDTEGPWSEYDFFSTSNTGIVNITDPVIDNDPSVITSNYLVVWDVTGPFDEFRVVVTRTDTEELHQDSGWVPTEIITQFQVAEMESGLEYRVEVTTRASEIPGNTAVRLITPDFAAPESPVFNAIPVNNGGYILLDIDNPDPQGDRPHPDENEVYKRQAGLNESFRLVARIQPNTQYRDYEVRSGIRYEYLIRAGVWGEDN